MSKRTWNLQAASSPYTQVLTGGWKATVDATGTIITLTYAGTGLEDATADNMSIDPDPGKGKP